MFLATCAPPFFVSNCKFTQRYCICNPQNISASSLGHRVEQYQEHHSNAEGHKKARRGHHLL